MMMMMKTKESELANRRHNFYRLIHEINTKNIDNRNDAGILKVHQIRYYYERKMMTLSDAFEELNKLR